MALIAFDAADPGATTGSGSGLSWSHTCTGTNLKLFVNTWTTASSTTGVTYNGVAMTLVTSQTQAGVHNSLWYLDNPATGSNTVTTTFASSGQVGKGSSSSYTNCATGIDNSTTNAANSTSISTILTPVADNCWIIYGVGGGSNTAYSSGNGSTTIRINPNNADGGNVIADTNAAISPAASTTMIINAGTGSNMAAIIASFAPVASAIVHNFGLMGVGA